MNCLCRSSLGAYQIAGKNDASRRLVIIWNIATLRGCLNPGLMSRSYEMYECQLKELNMSYV